MRSRHSGSVTARTVACLVLASTLAQGRERARPATLDAEAAAAMRQRITTPSRAHKRLDVFVGVWAARTLLWMDPSQPPAISEGTLEQKWIFDGRFLQQTYQGEFMGRPFSGLGYIGYDNYLKKYLSTWMDSAGTTIYTRIGRFDSEDESLTLTGEVDDYVRGKSIPVRERMAVVSPSEFFFETWEQGPDGRDYKVMEVRCTRKQ
ncbi:MAG TPA: DUF1579 domain-containing protein [Thermoanaerobaculia bacterium]|nr:DUF1579 domain-containing protein [Thermoanaerobaculia bacterium]